MPANGSTVVEVTQVQRGNAIQQQIDITEIVPVNQKPTRKLSILETADMIFDAMKVKQEALQRGDLSAVAEINRAAADIFRNHSVAMPAIEDQSESLEAALQAKLQELQENPELAGQVDAFRTRWGR